MTNDQAQQTNLSIIGGGNMARAMIQGVVRAGLRGDKIRVSEPEKERSKALHDDFGVVVAPDNGAAVKGSRMVILAVKPKIISEVLNEIKPFLEQDALVISIAAGITLETLASGLPSGQSVIRAMPNTPALIGKGVTVLCPGACVTPLQLGLAETLLKTVGEVRTVTDESLIDGVTALSGSGPAYLYLIIEALSDGGVACGLPRDLADWLSVHTVMGSAALVKETGYHPGVLKNQVTSPGGTTIAALQVLEEAGIRGTLMRAVGAAWGRSRDLRQKK